MADLCYYTPGKDVNYKLIGDINRKVKRINTHTEYSIYLKNKIIKTLNDEANTHSFAMELPNLYELTEQNYRLLRSAWNWAEINYSGEFSKDFIIELAGRIEPSLNHSVAVLDNGLGYRKSAVSLTGRNPPHVINAQKVPQAMDDLIYFLNNSSENPLIRSIIGHMHLIRIHPFYDGNGRTCRMIQNLILNYNDMPPIRVEYGEKNLYQHILGNALNELENRLSLDSYQNGENIGLFFEYLGSIENITLDRMEEELKKNRQYGFYLGDNDKAQIFMAKHIIENFLKQYMKNKYIKINLDQNKGMVVVKGDFGHEEIEPIIKNLKNKRIIAYLVSIQ